MPLDSPLHCIIAIVFTVVPQTPTISSSASDPVTDGDAFTLTCTTASTGLSPAFYIWSISNVDQSASESNTLTVDGVDITNVQDYKCKVSRDETDFYSAFSSVYRPSGLYKMIRVFFLKFLYVINSTFTGEKSVSGFVVKLKMCF